MKKSEWVKIGIVGVDSGQLMVCDPCYIDSEWEKEAYTFDVEYYFVFPDGTKEKVEHCSPRWFELIERVNSGELKLEDKKHREKPKHNFSYNAVAHATLSDKGYGQLRYRLGHAGVGVAFSSGFGDGAYEVWAKIKDCGEWGKRIVEVKIKMV